MGEDDGDGTDIVVRRAREASLRLVLLGPPGSGKGTLAHMMAKRLGVAHVSTGDLFRREIARRSALGASVQRYVTTGRLVPDELVVRVMTRRLGGAGARRRYVLDGFPRTLKQAQGLEAFLQGRGQRLHAALYLACPQAVLVERLGGRRVCGRCGAIYHLRNMPPRRSGRCDRCEGVLGTRRDDQVATIRKRLTIDRTAAKSLLAFYRRGGLLHRLDGSGTSEEVFRRVAAVQRGLPRSEGAKGRRG